MKTIQSVQKSFSFLIFTLSKEAYASPGKKWYTCGETFNVLF